MAFLQQDNEYNEKLQENLYGGGGGVLSGGSEVSPQGQPTSSGQWTNVNRYLENRPAVMGMAQNVAKGVMGQRENILKNIAGLQHQWGSDIERIGAAPGAVTGMMGTLGKGAEQAQIQAFRPQIETLRASEQALPQFQTQRNILSNIAGSAQGLTSGQQALNQLLLTRSPEAQQYFKDIADKGDIGLEGLTKTQKELESARKGYWNRGHNIEFQKQIRPATSITTPGPAPFVHKSYNPNVTSVAPVSTPAPSVSTVLSTLPKSNNFIMRLLRGL